MSRNQRKTTPRLGLAVLVLVALAKMSPLLADRRDQRSADYYSDAITLISKGQYQDSIPLLLEALRRGASEPNESQGSQTRFLVYQYDPYYWLGVAFMELGQDDRALLCLGKSESYGVVKRWPEGYADLIRRRERLESRYPVPTTDPPAAQLCLEREKESPGNSCLSILLEAFRDRSGATAGQQAYLEGELAYFAGDSGKALDRLKRAVADDPVEALERFRHRGLNREDYLPHFYLGLVLADLGRSDEARAQLLESRRQITSLHRPAVRKVLERALERLGASTKRRK